MVSFIAVYLVQDRWDIWLALRFVAGFASAISLAVFAWRRGKRRLQDRPVKQLLAKLRKR